MGSDNECNRIAYNIITGSVSGNEDLVKRIFELRRFPWDASPSDRLEAINAMDEYAAYLSDVSVEDIIATYEDIAENGGESCAWLLYRFANAPGANTPGMYLMKHCPEDTRSVEWTGRILDIIVAWKRGDDAYHATIKHDAAA